MYRSELRIGSSAVGRDNRLRLVNAVDFMQDCACFDLEDNPVLSRYFQEEHCGMYLIYRQVDLFHRPSYNEKIAIETSVFQCNRAIGSRNTVLLDKEGSVAMKDYEIGAFVDLERASMIRAPQEIVDAMMIDPPMEMERLPRKVAVPQGPCSYRQGTEFTVPRSYIDGFGHMNNSKYIEVTEPLLPDGFEVGRVRLEFKAALLEGETVVPMIYENGSQATITLMAPGQSVPRAVVEYTDASHCCQNKKAD